MTEQTRRNVLRYGIAIDLVILATGAGMFPEAPSPLLLVAFYSFAILLSSLRGGWGGAAVALALSIAIVPFAFPGVLQPWHFGLMTGIAVVGSALLQTGQNSKPRAKAAADPVASAAAGETRDAEISRDDTAIRVPSLVLLAPLEESIAVPDASQVLLARPFDPVEKPLVRATSKEAARRKAEEKRERQRLAEEARITAAQLAAEARAAEETRLAEEARLADAARETDRARQEEERRQAEEAQRAEEERAAEAARLIEQQRLADEERLREATRLEAQLGEERRIAEQERIRAEEETRARLEAEADAARRIEAERARAIALEQQLEAERRAAEEARARLLAEASARAVEEARRAFEEEQLRVGQERALERAAHEKELQSRVEAERRSVEESFQRQLEEERAVLRKREEQLAAELERKQKESPQQAPPPAAAKLPALPRATVASQAVRSFLGTVKRWFRAEAIPLNVGAKPARPASKGSPPPPARKPATVSGSSSAARPKLLMIERRRGTADTIIPKLRQRGIDAQVVERWVDAVDELFRLGPHALFLDIEHPEFDRIHRTVTEKSGQLPIILTGRSPFAAPATMRHAAFVVRPYDVDEVGRLAREALTRPHDLLAQQTSRVATSPVALTGARRNTPAPSREALPLVDAMPPSKVVAPIPLPLMDETVFQAEVAAKAALGGDRYEVACYTCRGRFDAVDADWCSCLAKERTLVCTNCLACFCKAPPSYKEKFWVEAPPRLFERKTAEGRRGPGSLPVNPPKEKAIRPLVLAVEDDEEIQAIVQRVCGSLGYGFIWAMNGQDGLELAREYRPNLILSDAFMPKLDGREMCRVLKESGELPECRMVVMTGLYTDTKYRSEAVRRFHVDDYVAKPVAITELINLLQKHLEGVAGLPAQEDLHEVHRAQLEQEMEEDADVSLADIIEMPSRAPASSTPVMTPRPEGYEISCYNCQLEFDATKAEWCGCVGRDNTLACVHCGGCFCKAPAAYRERFWIDAPPSLFERKMIGSKRQVSVRLNPAAGEVKRPLILLVEDDENVQLIVKTVVLNMGYGFVVGANGQEGLALAREYNPELILSDAFMPKLDGREMCRLLKEDPATAGSKAIIMTGLYTDRKYRNEALDYFKVDDYVAKPLAVDDLIRLFKKHLPQEIARAN